MSSSVSNHHEVTKKHEERSNTVYFVIFGDLRCFVMSRLIAADVTLSSPLLPVSIPAPSPLAAGRARAAGIHPGDALQALALQPDRDLVRRDGMGAARTGQGDGIAHVIAVPMRNQDEIEGTELLRRIGARRVAGDPGIEDDPFSTRRLEEERRVTQPGEGERRHDGGGSL